MNYEYAKPLLAVRCGLLTTKLNLKIMENTETYKIIDSQGDEVLTDISVSLFDFINDVDNMRQLYRQGRYTQSEQMRDKLAEKLDDVMRGHYNAR